MPDMEIGRGPEYLAPYPTTLFRGSFVPITELSKMIENGKVLLLCLTLLTTIVDWFEVIENLEEDLFDSDDWLSELLREPKDDVNVAVEPVESSASVAEELTLDPSLLTLPTYTNYPRSYTQTFEPHDLPMDHVFPNLTLQQSVSTEDEIRFTPSTNSILTPSGSSAHSQSPPRAVNKSRKRKPRSDRKQDRSDVLTTDLVSDVNNCCSN